jgi:hypothetical protein
MTVFKPEEHMRNLKGKAYLECKWRVVWFREEHPSGWIKTELLAHDPKDGLAVFKAEAGYIDGDGRPVVATGHGDETRADFGDFLTKAETKAIGRALALLGYGTQFAGDLDEDATRPGGAADSAVERGGNVRTMRERSAPAAQAPAADIGALREEVSGYVAQDLEGAELLQKPIYEMNAGELKAAIGFFKRRAAAARRA